LDAGHGIEPTDPFEQRLMGFCVAAQLDQLGETRSWWAERLGLSKSHISKMTVEPSSAFVEQLDLELESGEAQRLGPRLSDFYAELRPRERREHSQPVLDWLARYPRTVGERTVAGTLLESEVALKRCELLGRSGKAERDATIGRSITRLLSLASGPYGGSTVAHQRCAELGLRVPRAFFSALNVHFSRSPVGFRLLRTLDRFVNVWRGLGNDPDTTRNLEVEKQLASLLRRLARASSASSHLDPYPGAEWGITLARDCLRTGQERLLAHEWLAGVSQNDWASDRERLYAAWVRVSHPDGAASVDIAASLRTSNSPHLRQWSDLLERYDNLVALESKDREQQVMKCFPELWTGVHEAVRASAVKRDFGGVSSALESIIFAALVTPDSRTRRSLIESVAAAGLVSPTIRVLVRLYADDLAPAVRETIVFFLSRMREPNAEVAALFRQAASCGHPDVEHSALWGLGDIWRRDDVLELPETLAVLEQGAVASISAATYPRARIAAAHALAVISFTVRSDPDAGRAVAEVLGRVENAQTDDLAGTTVAALCGWGARLGQLDKSDDVVDPTSLGFEGPLKRDSAQEDDF
jgi:hypothetical protein